MGGTARFRLLAAPSLAVCIHDTPLCRVRHLWVWRGASERKRCQRGCSATAGPKRRHDHELQRQPTDHDEPAVTGQVRSLWMAHHLTILASRDRCAAPVVALTRKLPLLLRAAAAPHPTHPQQELLHACAAAGTILQGQQLPAVAPAAAPAAAHRGDGGGRGTRGATPGGGCSRRRATTGWDTCCSCAERRAEQPAVGPVVQAAVGRRCGPLLRH